MNRLRLMFLGCGNWKKCKQFQDKKNYPCYNEATACSECGIRRDQVGDITIKSFFILAYSIIKLRIDLWRGRV